MRSPLLGAMLLILALALVPLAAFGQGKASDDPALGKLRSLQAAVPFFQISDSNITCAASLEAKAYSTCVRNRLIITTGRVVQLVLSFIGILFLILAIYAGYLWLTAGGNEEQVTKAKDYLRNAVIGILVIVSAYIVSNFVVSQIVGLTSR